MGPLAGERPTNLMRQSEMLFSASVPGFCR